MQLELVGGSQDGLKVDISKDMEDTKIMTITYRVNDEIYIARKFHGEWVLFFYKKARK